MRKIVSVKPVPRKEPIDELRPWLLQVTTKDEAEEILAVERYLVTYECGHTQRWINRPKMGAYPCLECK